MKRKYNVEWYDYDLTQPRCRKFFTEVGARLFARYMENRYNVKTRTQHG